MHWWKAVLADDPEIDVQAVEPESSKLTDLDPETRQTVEKMMVRDRAPATLLCRSSVEQEQPSADLNLEQHCTGDTWKAPC